MSSSKFRNEIPIALSEKGVEVRAEPAGGMMVAFERWPRGDWRPLFDGLPQHGCEAEHWGYCLKGSGRLHQADGTVVEIRAGQAYYASPGHTFQATEDIELLEFTRPHARYEKDVEIILGNFARMDAPAKPSPR